MIFRRSFCDPFRRDMPAACFGPAAVSVAMMAGSAVLGAIGDANKAQAQAAQYNYQSQVARNNQIIAQRNALLARQQGEADVEKQQLKTSALEGSQRAALAAQGGDVNSGSPLDIVGDTARAGYTDAATLRNNAAYKAYNYDLQANDAAASANDNALQAANATANLPFSIGSSLLGTASSAFGKFKSWS